MLENVLVVIGVFFVLSGLAGVKMAPRMVEVQKQRGMMQFDRDEITEADRIRVTKGAGVVFTLIGFGLILYAVL